MEKLTKKQFIQALHDSKGYFISSLFNADLVEIIIRLEDCPQEGVIANAIYKVKEYQEKSNKIVAINDDGTIRSNRDFYGENKFYKHNDYIIHVNKQDNNTITMINI